ncbi:MAG TPA: asparagine synthase-related protein [Polyangiaceae bacterium]|nr:asparagine synthase-related protein [Polyangiaceae bacterium]
MSGICGVVGAAGAASVERMLAAIDYRGDSSDSAVTPHAALGYRFWRGRPNKSAGVLREGGSLLCCAGTLAPPVTSPAAWLEARLRAGSGDWSDLDGAFAFAHWDEGRQTLTLGRDPFGVRSLYYVEHAGVFYFASELKQLLAVAEIPAELDHAAIHKYLTFSFVPGEAVPIRGIRRLLPGHLLERAAGRLTIRPYFQLVEQIDEGLRERKPAVRQVRKLAREATARRLSGESEVGLFLSGGLDSSAVAVWLKDEGAAVRAFSLDFGAASVEREQAERVAKLLEIPQVWVPASAESVAEVFDDVVYKLDLPFGDPVTAPQYLLARAARAAGLAAVFNGEGGDQLFGGWTSKPMVAAELYAGLYESQETSREETYLRSYHRFYGLEDELYTPEFKTEVGPAGQRRALLRPYLEGEEQSFLNRVRLADISLKGSQNILPRAERMAGGFGLDVRAPLFDRRLAEASFRLPPELKLHGACEKYVLKLAMQKRLPEDIVWRKKFGMSVPITDFVFGSALSPLVEELLGEDSLRRRGLFRSDFVARLRAGQDVPGETRRRRIGERLWALLMLEAWLRRFVDGRGQRP